MNRDVFVIHSLEDEAIGEKIVQFLEEHGIRGWIRRRDFTAKEGSQEAVLTALASARIFIVVFSAASNDSRDAQNEVKRAMDSGKLILPLRIGNVAPTGVMELLLKRRYCVDAFGPPFERHLEEVLRIVKPFANQRANPTEAASISRTLPSPRSIRSRGPSALQVNREQMGPFQVAIKCPKVAEIDVPLTVELVVANQSTQLLELVEIGLRSETSEDAPNEVVPDLAPGTQATFLFRFTPRQEGPCFLRFAIQGYDALTKFGYRAFQPLRISNSGASTQFGSGIKKPNLSEPQEPTEVTRATMTFAHGEDGAHPPNITLLDGFEPLDIALDFAHSLDAECIANTRLELAIPFAFLGQAQSGTLLTLERLDGPSPLPHQEIRLSARSTFSLGRSREESDFLLWFWPRNEIHDAKTLRISKKHCSLSMAEGQCTVRNSGAASVTKFEDVDVDQNPMTLTNRGVLNFSGNYFLEVALIPPMDSAQLRISNLANWTCPSVESRFGANGCVTFRPASPYALPQQAVWLLSEGAFGTSMANALVFDLPELAEIQGRFHFFRGCFWIENCVDNGAVIIDGHVLKSRSIAPLVSGKTLVLGGIRFYPRISP